MQKTILTIAGLAMLVLTSNAWAAVAQPELSPVSIEICVNKPDSQTLTKLSIWQKKPHLLPTKTFALTSANNYCSKIALSEIVVPGTTGTHHNISNKNGQAADIKDIEELGLKGCTIVLDMSRDIIDSSWIMCPVAKGAG